MNEITESVFVTVASSIIIGVIAWLWGRAVGIVRGKNDYREEIEKTFALEQARAKAQDEARRDERQRQRVEELQSAVRLVESVWKESLDATNALYDGGHEPSSDEWNAVSRSVDLERLANEVDIQIQAIGSTEPRYNLTPVYAYVYSLYRLSKRPEGDLNNHLLRQVQLLEEQKDLALLRGDFHEWANNFTR